MVRICALTLLTGLLSSTSIATATIYEAKLLAPVGSNGYRVLGAEGFTQVGSVYAPAHDPKAVLSTDGGAQIVPLHPADYFVSEALAASGMQQVGFAMRVTPEVRTHALLWNGTAESAVNLQPASYTHSKAFGAAESGQVGIAWKDAPWEPHAMLWRGTADSAVSLHPAGWDWSEARGISGDKQVGWMSKYSGAAHAVLWSGAADQYVDLNPQGFTRSWANGSSAAAQVGKGVKDSLTRALMWRGTAESFVDLHPAGYSFSEAVSTAGVWQVGLGILGSADHALVWRGSSSTAIDLHPFLSELGQDFEHSTALAVNSAGQVFGYVNAAGGGAYAVVWTPVVPEPSTVLLAIGTLFLYGIRSHRSRPIRW